jgi:hypothetical protein
MVLCGLSLRAPELGPKPRLLREPLSGRSALYLDGCASVSRLGLVSFVSFISIPLT